MWLFRIIIFGLLYLFNALYSFLPKEFVQKHPSLKCAGIIVALILVGIFIIGEIRNYQHSSYAEVSKEGRIIRGKNFPWEIRKTKDRDGHILYTLVDRGGDPTALSVVPDNPKCTVYQSWDGMVIKFTCAEEKISDFTIKVKY